jgi:hypothetical protein
MSFQKNLGLLFLSIYLILQGLAVLFGLKFDAMLIVMGILALVAGILLLIGR